MKTTKNYWIAAAFVIATLGYLVAQENLYPETENEFIEKLKKQTEGFFKTLPQERVYVSTDKQLYVPGETIWFSAFLVNAQSMNSNSKSQIVHVELINPKGAIERKLNLISKNGISPGELELASDAPGGIYKLKAYTNFQLNEPDSLFFLKEIQVQQIVLPKLKMNIDFEKEAYSQGQEVVAKFTLQDNQNKILSNYPFTYSASINGESIINATSQTANDGEMYIKFLLPKKLKSSDGLLTILLDYNGSTESSSASIPIILNNINLSFFPEGGDMVEGLENKIAFKAINEFGKMTDCEAKIYDSNKKEVAEIKTFHHGMGEFVIVPKEGEQYFAKITKPTGIDDEFNLPISIDNGIAMQVKNENPNSIEISIASSKAQNLSLVAMLRDKIYYASTVQTESANKSIAIPTTQMPMGVCKLTLFNQNNLPIAERLVFVNKHRKLDIAIKTEKDKYLPREKIKASIQLKDDKGIPCAGKLSLSVTNDGLKSFANDKQGDLLSHLFLEQDIKEKIEEPKFYFGNHPKANKTLDLLMLTSGWRRFTWMPIINNQKPMVSHLPEQTTVSGTVLNASNSQPLKGVNVKIGNKNFTTNSQGKFSFKNIDLSEKNLLTANIQGFEKYQEELAKYDANKVIYMNDNNYQRLRAVREDHNEQLFNNVLCAPAMGMAAPAFDGVAINNFKFTPVEKGAVANKNAVKRKENKMEFAAVQKVVVAEEIAEVKKPIPLAANLARQMVEDLEDDKIQVQVNNTVYFRSREFPSPNYSSQIEVTTRTDFRSTIYWYPNLQLDETGKKEIEFYAGDDISSFCFVAEGLSESGLGGVAEKKIFTQMPFSIESKFPIAFVQDDIIEIPLTINNNTANSIKGNLTVVPSKSLEPLQDISLNNLEIKANSFLLIPIKFKVQMAADNQEFSAHFSSNGITDGFAKQFNVLSKGFPIDTSFSGKETNASYSFDIVNPVQGSINASVTAYPSVVSDLLKGVESILREPSGCFEQTSMSSYPNILVKNYLKTAGIKDEGLMTKADKLIVSGYKKLTAFETKEKGYEWFGGAPGHEALTAYGLLQFHDMKQVYGGVENAMLDRTTKWLLASRDGKGGYTKNPRALDSFGGADKDITDAYITYALCESGYKDLEREIDYSENLSNNSNDQYIMALTINTLFDSNRKTKAEKLLKKLIDKQEKDGSFNGAKHSITRSTHNALKVETTSLAIMAMLKTENKYPLNLNKAVEFLLKARSGNGDFGNTQSTIMALKALTAYAEYSKQTSEDGILECYVNGKKVGEQFYKAGTREAISIDGLNKYLNAGKNKINLNYKNTKNPLPYSVNVSWNSTLPKSSVQCEIDVETKLSNNKVKQGNTVRLTANLKNTKNQGQASTMALIGIPSNCSVQPWQLKEMQEKKLFDFYEIKDNLLVIYYRQMAPSEEKTLNFDLKAEFKGICQAPASRSYLYYTNEFKKWNAPLVLEVN